jgi:hypothetical protein
MNTKALIESTGWKIGYAEFVKRDGTIRKMWFTSKIHSSHFCGGERAYDPDEKRLTFVRDIHLPSKDCIRAIRWDAIKKLAVRGNTYTEKQLSGKGK